MLFKTTLALFNALSWATALGAPSTTSSLDARQGSCTNQQKQDIAQDIPRAVANHDQEAAERLPLAPDCSHTVYIESSVDPQGSGLKPGKGFVEYPAGIDATTTRMALLDFPVTRLAAKDYKDFSVEVAVNGSAVSSWELEFNPSSPLKSAHILSEIVEFAPTGLCSVHRITSYARIPSDEGVFP